MICRTLLLLLAAALLVGQGIDEQALRTAVDAYRQSWQAMSAEQRKRIVDAGGMTPERYEQMFRGASQSTPTVAPPRASTAQTAAAASVNDMVRSSATDLDLVRDANLARVRDESCPAEIAITIAALRSRLTPSAMPPRAAMLELADTWNRRNPATARPDASNPAQISAEVERLLTGCKR
jgi:hypothetical protein